MKIKDQLGDEIKAYEDIETSRRLIPNMPVIVRVDGRAFHTLTRHMDRPVDVRFIECMDKTCAGLVEELRPAVGYVQSDEITLVWPKFVDFDSRVHKLVSVSAGLASSIFTESFTRIFNRDGRFPHFDSRVFQVPDLHTALKVLQWRENDASRNSVSMLAQHHFSHKELHQKDIKTMKTMLEDKEGIIWGNELPRIKRGAYYRRIKFMRELTSEELAKIPEFNRPKPGHKVMRSRVEQIEIGPLYSLPVSYAIKTLFGDESYATE